MVDLYRAVKRLPDNALKDFGLKRDALREGFYKELGTPGVSAVFNVTGGWSYVEIHRGLRFSSVNDLLFKTSVKAGWSKERSQMFRLKLVSLFWEKIGDFCAAKEDINVYCPHGSRVVSEEDIAKYVIESCNVFSELCNLKKAIDYAATHSLFEPFGKYMIPAAAKLIGNNDLWKWSIDNLTANNDEENERRIALLNVMATL